MRWTTAPARPSQLCVLLLEDVRTAQARLQQEKLAAMGRVSAGIAHEIRNPLAAIAQANALLLEDPLRPAQRSWRASSPTTSSA
jgi:two-component system, NtrC family, sensor histidine kinase PilS